MADLRTEEEQLEVLKRWWDENGKALLVGVVLAVAAIFGWKWWQNHQLEQREAASILYQELAQLSVAQQPLSEESQATAAHLSAQLKEGFPDSLYARYAALLMAKQAVERDDLAQAEQELRWALEQSPAEHPLRPVITLRLARVLYAQQQPQDALALLDAAEAGALQAAYAELRGDLYLALGDADQARAAYQAAADALAGRAEQRPLLQMKLDELAVETP